MADPGVCRSRWHTLKEGHTIASLSAKHVFFCGSIFLPPVPSDTLYLFDISYLRGQRITSNLQLPRKNLSLRKKRTMWQAEWRLLVLDPMLTIVPLGKLW